jgi:hypothetical protein
VQQLESHVHTIRESQVKFREQIDKLAIELCQISEDQKDLYPFVKKQNEQVKEKKIPNTKKKSPSTDKWINKM